MFCPYTADELIEVRLHEPGCEGVAGLTVFRPIGGSLPDVIIVRTWVFVRDGKTLDYHLKTAAVVHAHDAVAVPMTN